MHTDPELLSLLALGEPVGTENDRRHVNTCRECAEELSALQRLATLGRSADEETIMAMPSPDVWARICHELDFDLDASRDPHAATRFSDVPVVAESPEHKPRRSPLAIIKAALGSSSDSAGHLRAHARLAPIQANWALASGTAEIATDKQGRRLLEVALHADLPESGVRQAWLVHRDDPSKRQTLGILDGSHGLWTIEQSIDLEQYAILDISQQDIGQTEHSGHTLVRGQFALVS